MLPSLLNARIANFFNECPPQDHNIEDLIYYV
jgi:hypothetical protein